MLSVPTKFAAAQNRIGGTMATIVKVDTVIGAYYFSDRDIILTDGKVFPLLKSHSGIRESIDIYSKKWSVSSVTVVLHNVPLRREGDAATLSPEWSFFGIRFREASIYILRGEDATSLSDCLLRYQGLIVDPLIADDDTFTFRISDQGALYNPKICKTLISDDFDPCPKKSVGRKIPIAYGKFTLEGADDATFTLQGTGLARGEYGTETKSIFSNHVLNAITRMFIDVGIPDPALVLSPTLDDNDSGVGSGDIGITREAYAWVHATQIESSDETTYRTFAWGKPINAGNALDRDDSTYAQLMDDQADVIESHQAEECLFPITEDGFIVGLQGQDYIVTGTKLAVQYKATLTMTADDFRVRLWQAYNTYQQSSLGVADQPDGSWLTFSGLNYVPATKDYNYAPGFYIENDDGTGDGVRNNEEMARLYGIRLRLQFKIGLEYDRFAECEGITYGSWITSRSSNYSSGDVIEDPAGIIESILRDWLGFSSSDIDLTSFIDAENTSVQARLNLHSDNDLYLNDAIRQLCEQSTFAFFWSAAGKAKLIPLNDKSSSIDRTIPWSHIKKGSIKITQGKKVINKMTIASRWHAEAKTYRDIDIYEDSTSQTQIGFVLEYEAEWPNICGSSAQHVAQHLVNSTDGLWSKIKSIVEFETIGATNADLEIGTRLHLDTGSVGYHRRFDLTNWSSRRLTVVDILQLMDGTKVTAIELY